MTDAVWVPRHNPWLVAMAVTLGAFMEVLDTTIVNVALPHIAGSLSVSNDESTWALSTYLVANGIVLTISGTLSRRMGRKGYFLLSVAGFTTCSLACGVATELWQLLLFRALQGFFGGGLQPTQQAIILGYFPPEKRQSAFSLVALAVIIAPILGPVLGGFITDQYSWRWIFLLNVPVGILTVACVMHLVEDPPDVVQMRATAPPFDFVGFGFVAIALGCLEVACDRGSNADWLASPTICGLFALSAAGFVLGIWYLLRTHNPIVDLRVFRDRNLAVCSVQIAIMGFVLYASAVLIPQYAQEVLGYNATWSGLVLAPGGALLVVLIPMAGKLMKRVATKYVIMLGGVLLAASLVYSMQLVPDLDFDHLMYYRMAQTAGLAFLFVPISTQAYATLAREKTNDASALFNMARNVVGGIGISASTALLANRHQVRQETLIGHLTPLEQPYRELAAQITQALIDGGTSAATAAQLVPGIIYQTLTTQAAILSYADVFAATAVLALLLVVTSFLLSGGKAKPTEGGVG